MVKKILNNCNVKWWLDSGSLLGLVRDNKFLKHDNDIDIGIIPNDNFSFAALIKMFKINHFRIVIYTFCGKVFKMKAIPTKKSDFNYIVDMQFYHKYGKEYCCPQFVFKEKLSFSGKLKKKIIRCKKSLNSSLFYRLIRIFGKNNININKEKNSLFDIYLWRIPSIYVDSSFTKICDYNCFLDKEAYLEYRYGNWKIPQTKWKFTRDDKALKISNFKEVREIMLGD